MKNEIESRLKLCARKSQNLAVPFLNNLYDYNQLLEKCGGYQIHFIELQNLRKKEFGTCLSICVQLFDGFLFVSFFRITFG